MSLTKNYADLEKTEEIVPTEQIEIQKSEVRLYKRRWFMLIIFVLYSMSNAMQWIQYSIISGIIEKYYNVDSFAVNWTSLIFMVTYIPLIFPASWLLGKLGTRISVIIGAIGTCIGAWIKVFSILPDRFLITFMGQTVVAVSQIFILSLPARIAAVWFGQREVSTACSIGVFGNQVGVALGFVFPPILVKNSDNNDIIADGLRRMYYSVAVITTIILFLIILFFDDKPALPPSPAQAAQQTGESNGSFMDSVWRLLTNRGYCLLLFSYGINVGVFYAISTLLSVVILKHFPLAILCVALSANPILSGLLSEQRKISDISPSNNDTRSSSVQEFEIPMDGQEDAGVIGLVIVVVGMVGSIICGYILDKTRLFKETTLIVYACAVLGMLGFAFSINTGTSMAMVYFSAAFLGFFMTGYLPVGFELAVELTYPESEGTSAGLINAGGQLFGIAFTMLYAYLIDSIKDFGANLCLIAMLIIGTLLTAFIPSDLRRQLATSTSRG